jgi:two-component system chemotaxis sensor kinase CheA
MLSEYYQVETVLDSQDALERMQRGQYQVALVDLGMPGMPGDQLVEKLRQIDPFLATVLITGWKLEPDDSRRQAFDLALQKPFHSLTDVQDVITQSIRIYESRMDERE